MNDGGARAVGRGSQDVEGGREQLVGTWMYGVGMEKVQARVVMEAGQAQLARVRDGK